MWFARRHRRHRRHRRRHRPGYAGKGMDSAGRKNGYMPITAAWRERGLRLIGRAVLGLRLYRGWSQHDLEVSSGVDQTTISRLERGRQRGFSVRSLAAIIGALTVDDVVFERAPSERPTSVEIMLSGDRWAMASKKADRLLGWGTGAKADQVVEEPPPADSPWADQATADDATADEATADQATTDQATTAAAAWFGDAG